MGQLGASLAGLMNFASAYHAQITLAFIIVVLVFTYFVSRGAKRFICELDIKKFSAPNTGNKARDKEKVCEQLRRARKFRDAKWLEVGGQVTNLFIAGLVVPTIGLLLFAMNYNALFDGSAFLPSDSTCASNEAAAVTQLTGAQFISLLISSMIPVDFAAWLFPGIGFDLSYNLELPPMYVAFLAHKVWAFQFTWQILRDFTWKLPGLASKDVPRISFLEGKLQEMGAEC